jgi:Putative prokaryotic signal transducing protein
VEVARLRAVNTLRYRHFLHSAPSEVSNAAAEYGWQTGVAMAITRESLLDRFRLLSDKELLGLLQSGDLIDLAREVAAEELRHRGVELAKPATEANTANEDASGSEDNEDALGSEDNAPTGGGDLVLIARFFTPVEAHMLQSRLQADGVLAVVVDAQLVGVNPLFTLALGGVRVLVPESDYERAREIVSAIERGDYALDDQKASE